MGHVTTPSAPYWARPIEDLTQELNSGPDGLSSAAAAAALPQTRARATSRHTTSGPWMLLARQFTSPIMLILIGATILSGVLGDWTDAIIILVIILASGLLDFAQERGAQGAMEKLLSTIELTATVLRDSSPREVPFDEVVAGDVIEVGGGDIVPADAVVISSNDLALDQSSLTGETFPATKAPGPSPAAAAIGERSNVLFSGTHVSSGSGRALVVATGRDTQFGQVVQAIAGKQRATGFEHGMTRFGLLLARIMVVLVILIFIANLLLNRPLVDSALFSLSLAVGLTPQLLPAIVGISLSRGARIIAKHDVIVKRLNAIEDFGAMTVLCTDKTGTMTSGTITLAGSLDITGAPAHPPLQLGAWNAALQQGISNPMDAAIAKAARAAGVDLSDATRLAEIPYDFDRKRLSVLVDAPDGRLLITKGAAEQVLAVCTQARDPDGTVRPIKDVQGEMARCVDQLAAQGMRVLAVAAKPAPGKTSLTGADEAELTLEGLLTFADPVKPDAAGTIADFAAAGVGIRMITGDAKPIATHIAAQLGMDATAHLTGAEIAALDDAALAKAAASTHVFCETSPHDKQRIISALVAAGETVGYMGDGINDAPALKAADIGISVKGAADVASESASIVMLQSDLRALLDGMRQGRRTFANTMKYIYMTTSANFGNMISMAIASLVLPFLPLLASQILMINLLTDIPATTISTDNVDERQLARPQRWNMRLIRNYMIVFGLVSSAFDIITFIVLRLGFHAGEREFQSSWFLASILTEVLVLFVLRTRGPAWRSRPSQALVAISAAVVLASLLIVMTPIGSLLHLSVPPTPLLLIVVLISVGYCIATEITKVFFWRAPSHAQPAKLHA